MRSLMSYNRPNTFSSLLDDVFNRSIMDFVGNDMMQSSPMVNIIEHEDNYTVEVAAPGMKQEDCDVQIVKDNLVIKGEKKQESEDKDSKGNFTRREFNYQSFTKRYTLSEDINRDSVDAKYENGVLHIVLEKVRDEEKPEAVKRIEIG